MPLCRDREAVRPLLDRAGPAAWSINNLTFGRAGESADWLRVDDLAAPRAVLCRSRFLYLWAETADAARQVLAELPRRHHWQFGATPRRFIAAVGRLRRIRWTAPCYYYTLESGRFRPECTHRVGLLSPADAGLIVRFWPHGRSRRYLEERIRRGPTCAIRRRGRLVAWALTHQDGAMGLLHVLDEYRGQGMARSITSALVQRLGRRRLPRFLYIVRNNQASIRLTESMGFTRKGSYCWFGT